MFVLFVLWARDRAATQTYASMDLHCPGPPPKITHLRPHPLRHIAEEAIVNLEEYKRILLAKGKGLAERIELAVQGAREQTEEGTIETGDKSVADVEKEEQFTEADLDTQVLKQVRDALQRIENGIFGTCIVDGRPINEKRLAAIPWTPCCLKHQQELEKSRPPHTPTL
jgi:DnaK suppressor protein